MDRQCELLLSGKCRGFPHPCLSNFLEYFILNKNIQTQSRESDLKTHVNAKSEGPRARLSELLTFFI